MKSCKYLLFTLSVFFIACFLAASFHSSSYAARGRILLSEPDGNPNKQPAYEIQVPNGSLGGSGGVATLDFETSSTGMFSPSIAVGPPIINSGFAGTISSSGTTVTFTNAADAVLAGYSATNAASGLGTTLIAATQTRYITAWTNSTTCTVSSAPSPAWGAGTAITSVQLPLSAEVTSDGTLERWLDAAGNEHFVGSVSIGATYRGSTRAGIDAAITAGVNAIELTGDIALAAHWDLSAFTGQFRTNGHQISGAYTFTAPSDFIGSNGCFGTSTIVAGLKRLLAQWWGLSPTGTAESNAAALLAAITCAYLGESVVLIDNGVFLCDPINVVIPSDQTTFGIHGSHSSMNPISSGGTVLKFTGLTGSQIGLSITNSVGYNYHVSIRDITILGPSSHKTTQATTTVGLKLYQCVQSEITNVVIKNFYTGCLASFSLTSRYRNVRASQCYYGIKLDNANSGVSIRDCNFELNYCGIAISQGLGISIDTVMLESCNTGLYINPANSDTISDIDVRNLYFENTTTSIDIGRDTFWVKSGTISKIFISGGSWISSGLPICRNIVDLWLNVYQQYLVSFDLDATVYWSCPPGNHYSVANASTETKQLNFTEFFIKIDNSSGYNPMTITLPDIDSVPINIPIIFKRVDAHINTVTIDGSGAQTIDGGASVNINGQHSYLQLIKMPYATKEWKIIGAGIP